VVDAAVDYTQPQLVPRLAGNTAELNGKTGIDDEGNGYIDDYYGWDFLGNTNNPSALVSSSNGHGTHVSGIIAADHTQGPVEGLAPGAQIIPANFMDSTGSGSLGTAIVALQYVAQRGAKVINASWGGSACSQSLKNVMSSLSSQGVLLVVAAGNNGEDIDSSPDYPANFNFANQLNVASTTENDIMDTWSNYSYNLVHLGAPGDTIYSTFPGATQAYMSGTSMATPMVTGTAALLWSFRPTATAAQIRQAILSGVDLRGLATTTKGRLNVSNSMTALKALVP
jgi:subtilisin family serine protease